MMQACPSLPITGSWESGPRRSTMLPDSALLVFNSRGYNPADNILDYTKFCQGSHAPSS
jgi:hypothetical protein